jgi:hypothetical protein
MIRIPPGYFGAPLGLAGLAVLWLTAASSIGVSPDVGDAIAMIAGGACCGLAAAYLRQGAHQILADFGDTVAGPMLAAPIMSALVLGSVLCGHARTAGHVVVIVSLIVGAPLCGLLIGQWMTGGIDEDRLGPALYLPGGGIGFVGSEAADTIGLHGIDHTLPGTSRFLLPAPFAAALIIAGLRVLDTGNGPSLGHRHYDLLGSLTVTGSMLALVYSVVEAPSHGWLVGRTLGGLALSALLLVAFVVVENRSPHPLVRLGILRTRTLVSADIAGMLYFGSYLGFQFLASATRYSSANARRTSTTRRCSFPR